MNTFEFSEQIEAGEDKVSLTNEIISKLEADGYSPVEINTNKPWGAYIRLDSNDADAFVDEHFEDLTPEEARLGIEGAELSPKILIVSPEQRLSWQLHHRRAERWKFLTKGGYHKSLTDDEGELHIAEAGEVVQFARGERHRLVALQDGYTLVAEIWQHTDSEHPSDEDDIVRLQDDYSR